MRECPPQSVLLLEFSAPHGQSAALEALLSKSNCGVIKSEAASDLTRDRDSWLTEPMAQRRAAVALLDRPRRLGRRLSSLGCPPLCQD